MTHRSRGAPPYGLALTAWLRGKLPQRLMGACRRPTVTPSELTLTEMLALGALTVTIVLGVALPIFGGVRASLENMEAQATLHSALLDVQAVYAMSHGYAPPRRPTQLLWPYLQEQYPGLRWGKYSDSPKEVAVARAARGERQSIELTVFSNADVCWSVLVVRSPESVVITSRVGIDDPGIYYGASTATSCGPSYITPPPGGWRRSLPGSALSGP